MTENNADTLATLAGSVSPDAMIQAFLHDPPDKALAIPGHQARAARYLTAILDEVVGVDSVKTDSALGDQLSAIAERLPMPSAGANGERAVGPVDGKLRVHHPLGGISREIDAPAVNEARIVDAIGNLCSGIDDRRARFRLLWRCLPDRMAELDPAYSVLPADTRMPDHTIWNHADTVAAFAFAVGATGNGAHALLSFAISPVQSFIAAARSLRDLRNGSLLLSWLAFRAMRPVLERIGPTALIFPSLRGNAMVDQWLRGEPGGLRSKIAPPDGQQLLAPTLPNKFLALVPMGPDGAWARVLADAVETAAADAWHEVARAVRRALGETLDAACPGWAERWDTQIDKTWDLVASIMPLRELGSDKQLAEFRGAAKFEVAFPEAQKVRDLAAAIPQAERPRYDQSSAGRWQASVDMAARLLEAARGVRRVPVQAPFEGEVPAKCSLLGTWEQMGPGNRDAARKFWEQVVSLVRIKGARVREGEALCSVALVKRFAMGAFLAEELGIEGKDRFPDTATVAARPWLNLPGAERVKEYSDNSDWNGQWLHWTKPDAEQDEPCPPDIWKAIKEAKKILGPPPTYYAVLTLDGDSMGDWLAGKNSPTVRAAMHPKLVKYFDALYGTEQGMAAPRPIAPSLHAAISEALSNFAQYVVPGIVEHYQGALIYAGGDDALALLPTETVLACARDLDRAFRGDPGANGGAPEGYYRTDNRDLLMMGPCASVSAGVAVVHYKEDLRAALELGRAAERHAKDFGRNALSLTVARRSGEEASAALAWDLVGDLAEAVEAFRRGASDRWAYRLRALLPVFRDGGPPEEAFVAESRRQLARGDDTATRELPVASFYERLRAPHEPGTVGTRETEPWIDTAERLVTLWQSASFLARGRDVAGRT
jgi:CRISPR-associated protein Cmr2